MEATSSAEEKNEGESRDEQQQTTSEFVNQGLMLWEQSRTRWLGHQQKQQPPQATAAAAASRTIGPSTSGGGAVSDGTTDSTSLYSNSAAVRPAAAAIPMEVDEIIEVVFATPQQTASAQGPPKFPRTVPLPQMVDILVDLWEAEGLDI